MQRVKSGDHEAFSALLSTHWSPLVLYAETLLGDLDSAYDAVQEAFIRLWQRRQEWKGKGSVQVWLFRTVRHLCVSEQRKRSVRARRAAETAEACMSRPLTPLEEIENTELRGAVNVAVQALSPRRREAFTLFYLRDLSYRAVGEVMGIREQSVANHVQAALAQLRMVLKDRFDMLSPESEPGEPSTGR